MNERYIFRFFRSYYFQVDKEFHVRAVYFYGSAIGSIRLNPESSEYAWFELDNLPKEMAFNQRLVLEEYRGTTIRHS